MTKFSRRATIAEAMTPTLAHPAKTMRERSLKVKSRKRSLVRSGHTYLDLAALAHVSYSMAWKWMNGERVSEPCARAFQTLTGRAA